MAMYQRITLLILLSMSLTAWGNQDSSHSELSPEEQEIMQEAQEDGSLSHPDIDERDRDLWDTQGGEVEYDADDPGDEEIIPEREQENL